MSAPDPYSGLSPELLELLGVKRKRHRSVKKRNVVMVISLMIIVVTAGWYGLIQLSHSARGPVADGPTFYQALAAVNGSVAAQVGGPWVLFSVTGIAAQVPFSPDVVAFEYSLPGAVVAACDRAFNGVTLWNGSIPVFTGSFSSGTAPFWQFAFYSNSSNEVLIATTLAGTGRVYAPISATNECVRTWQVFAVNPHGWVAQIVENGSLPVNTPVAAQVVWSQADVSMIREHEPLAEVYTSGPEAFVDTESLPWGFMGVDFFGCGLQGIIGHFNPLYFTGVLRNGTYGGSLMGYTNCVAETVPVAPGVGNATYSVNSTSAATVTSNGTRYSTYSIQLSMYDSSTGLPENNDGWGVANWMVSMNLSNQAGTLLPVGPSRCPVWVSSMTDCVADGEGWYAVLFSASGQWQSSYGVVSGTARWTGPLAGVMTDEELVVVTPLTWPVSGVNVQLGSTVSFMGLNGTLPMG